MVPIQLKLSDPKTHPELYQLLYAFGQYYPKFALLPREGYRVPGVLDLLNQVLQPPVSPNFSSVWKPVWKPAYVEYLDLN